MGVAGRDECCVPLFDGRDYSCGMEIVHGLERFVPPASGIVLTIGNCDGVHRGHARLLETAHAIGERLGAPVAVMTFDPHPLAILAPERAPAPLTTLEEKLALLARLGVAYTLVLRSEPALLGQQALDFLASLVAHCRPRALVEGPDFNFGRGRSGNIATLREHAPRWGYEVHLVPAVHAADLPTHPTISSTSIRQALRDGRVGDANLMLGRPYRITGKTEHGQHRGAGLGFPTANLGGIVHLLPQEAVYAAIAQIDAAPASAQAAPTYPAERTLAAAEPEFRLAAVNIGPQPTFAQELSRVEAHVLDYQGDLRGRRVGLHFLARLREQQRFANPTELVEQIRRDVAATRAFGVALDALRRTRPVAL